MFVTDRQLTVWFCLSGSLLAAAAPAVAEPNMPQPVLKLTGPDETVYSWAASACDRSNTNNDEPDAPARAFRWNGGVQLIASSSANLRFVNAKTPPADQGKFSPAGFAHLEHSCASTLKSAFDPDPAHFQYKQWNKATYEVEGKNGGSPTVYAFVHNEFHGSEIKGMCPSNNFFNCWVGSTTESVSTDGGATYRPIKPPPFNLVATAPYPYPVAYPPTGANREWGFKFGPVGAADGSNIFRNPNDGYYYQFVTSRAGYRDFPRGDILMRTNNLADPTSWRVYNGTDSAGKPQFTGQFIDPYRASKPPVTPIFTPVATGMEPSSVTWNSALQTFMVIGLQAHPNPHYPDGPTNPGNWIGVYYAFSPDLIHWSPRQAVDGLIAPSGASWHCGDPSPVAYPSVIDPTSQTLNFDVTGSTFYVYFSRIDLNANNCARNFKVINLERRSAEINYAAKGPTR
ncbi:hypothetical protein [Rhodoblastus sp.]|uniref:hypothetical protein n=1 Tax=Rhodoblastus sp. TaxID=1962975 RepID=UPI003F9873A0